MKALTLSFLHLLQLSAHPRPIRSSVDHQTPERFPTRQIHFYVCGGATEEEGSADTVAEPSSWLELNLTLKDVQIGWR